MINKIINKIKKKKWNEVLDREVSALLFEQLDVSHKKKINVKSIDIKKWLRAGGLDEFITTNIHKKGLEFFFSYYILNVKKGDSVLDAAGGRSKYLEALRRECGVDELYLSDHIYEGVQVVEHGISVVGGDVSNIHLDNESVDKIACHHAFEHFQESKDVAFIKEAYRLLKKRGVLVIIPLFLVNKYIECWNVTGSKHFDHNSCRLYDPTASLPGGDDDGHFARLYDLDNFKSRILNIAKECGFSYEIIECEVDGFSVPDMVTNFGSMLNKPIRALTLTKN